MINSLTGTPVVWFQIPETAFTHGFIVIVKLISGETVRKFRFRVH